PGRRGAAVYALAALSVLLAAAALWGWLRPGPPPVVNRYSLFLRSSEALQPTPLGGTEGGTSPLFSPDGRSHGFLVGGRSVRVISLGGGPAITLSDSINSSGGD